MFEKKLMPITIAGVICLLLSGGHFSLLSLIAGTVLLGVLFSFGRKSCEAKGERMIFCLAGATSWLLASGVLLPLVAHYFPHYAILLPGFVLSFNDLNLWLIIFWLLGYGVCWRLTDSAMPVAQSTTLSASQQNTKSI